MLKQSKTTTSSASSPLRRGREERSLREASQNSNSKLTLNYYSPYLSIWGSVDPMSDKYPHQSNYMYCSGRPVNVIDPDGRDEWEVNPTGDVVWKKKE